MAGKNRYSRGKSKKQSLASRKREKDVSSALLENAFQPRKPEEHQPLKKGWESAVPRKMRILMRAAEGTSFRKAHREDVPRPAPSGKHGKAQKAAGAHASAASAAQASSPAAAKAAKAKVAVAATAAAKVTAVTAAAATAGPPPADRVAPSKPETAAAEADRKRADADALGAALAARRKTQSKAAKAAKPPGFGATNNRPPELKVNGRFGRIAAAAASRWLEG